MTEGKEFRTQVQEPFAVLQVPESVLPNLIDNPNLIEDLKRIIGVKVLVVSQDVRLLHGSRAREEAERMHDEIESFLDQPKEGAAE